MIGSATRTPTKKSMEDNIRPCSNALLVMPVSLSTIPYNMLITIAESWFTSTTSTSEHI